MNIFDLLGITVALIMVIIVEIIMCKDIKKRIKNNDYDNETVTKLRMIHVAIRLCVLIFFVILLVDYLSFLKII